MKRLSALQVNSNGKMVVDIHPFIDSLKRLNQTLERATKQMIMLNEIATTIAELNRVLFIEDCKQRMRINL